MNLSDKGSVSKISVNKNSSRSKKQVLQVCSVFLGAAIVTALASANEPPKSAPSHASAPSRPASAPHAAAPSRPAGAAPRTGAPSGANNRAGSQTNRPGGAAANNTNRGAGNVNNRPNSGSNANSRVGQGGGNTRGTNGASGNNRGQAAGANNRGGANGANRGAGNNAGNTANNRGGAAAAGRHQPAGTRSVALKNGGSATFRKNGQVRTIQTHGMTINHGMRGTRQVTSVHNGRTVVSYGGRGGYSQRAYYNHGGRAYVQRTYFVGGRSYAYGYHSYYYGGHPYYGYAPSFYYGPAYYGWAYNPWPAPVYFGWGWGGSPWYGYYGPYFAPYPVYPTAAFWLTDYFIAASLQAAYNSQQDAAANETEGLMYPSPATPGNGSDELASLWTSDQLVAANLGVAYGAYMLGGASAANSGATGLTPEVKQAISDEMKQEIAAEKDAAAKGQNAAPSGDEVPSALDPKIRYFVVATEEDLTTSSGAECALTGGDVVYRTGDKPDADNMVDATVKASKKDECPVGSTIGVAVDDLQEMHNQLRIQMDAGLKELADKQGKNGLPTAPDTKTQPGEVPAPSPDNNVGNDLKQQQKDADAAEAEAKQSQ